MFSGHCIRLKNCAAVLIFFLLLLEDVSGQDRLLDSVFTFNEGTVKTGQALKIISRATGYNFTYDSRIINAERKTAMNFSNLKLRFILDNLLGNDSLAYSVIGKYIIISLKEVPAEKNSDKVPAWSDRHISGKVIDEESSEALAFATVGLKNSGKGTITNISGEFSLNITPDYLGDTLFFSYLGYVTREIPVSDFTRNNLSIAMKREFISIPEIVIRSQIPQEIINKVIRSIPENYGNSPALLTGFYREGVLKKTELQTYSEAVIRIWKSSYSGSLFGDQIKVLKSRKIENIDRSDTLALRLKAGLGTCLELDGMKNIFDFLDYNSMNDYTYRITDIVTVDDEAAWEIEFGQKQNVEQPLFKGVFYVNRSDYAVLQADFELNLKYINKIRDSYVSSQSHGYNTWPLSVKYSVSYRKMNNRYFLSHVRGDLLFASKKKRKLFSNQFNVFFELAVTGMNLKNVARFDREELAPVHSVFSKTINKYDPEFWGNQDFLKPEENLLQALRNMKVRLQEFTE
jgi:hypothetical protein